MKKRLFSVVLAIALVLGIAAGALAQSLTPSVDNAAIKAGESVNVVKCSKIVYRLCNHMVYSFDILKASQKKRKRWRWLGRKGLWK